MELLTGLPDLTTEAVLADAVELRRLELLAGATKLLRATEWADLHPVVDEDDEGAWPDWSPTLPQVAWYAPAELAAAFGLTTDAGRDLIHESLELRHRLPRVWARVLAGQLEGWRARRITQVTLNESDEVAAAIDAVVAPIAHKVGLITLDRLLTETLIRLDPARVLEKSRQRLDGRYVRVFDEMSHEGVMKVHISADLKDVHDFNATVTEIAAALAADPSCPESVDIRRAMAIGVLADPEQAAALLHQHRNGKGEAAADGDGSAGEGATPAGAEQSAAKPGSGLVRTPRKQALLHFHISHDAVTGTDPVGRVDYANRVVLAELIRGWCGRADTQLTVLPVIDLNQHLTSNSYQPPETLARQTELTHPTCQFPWCTRPSRRCDKDHAVPHDEDGATCSCNLVPLCRRHHRFKTLTGWRYHVVEPGLFLWQAPHGRHYLRDPSGTTDLGPPPAAPDTRTASGDRSPPWTGCFHPQAS